MSVSILYHNNVHVRVDCTRDIMSEMNEYFSFFAEGYRYHPLFKQRRWDGRVRLLHASTGMIYRGLLDRVVQFCEDREYPVHVDERLVNDDSISIDETQSFIDGLNFVSKGNPISLRDYQVEAVNHCLTKKRSLVVSPTSSGKSAIIAAISRHLQTLFDPIDEKILIIVPNISLVNQFAYDFCDYFSNDIPWLKTDPVHMIFGGKEKETDSPIIVSTYQSLMKLPKSYFEKIACVIVDECFSGESKVLTPNGYVEIQNIKEGDIVVNYCEKTKSFKEDVVVEVYKNMQKSSSEKMYDLELENGTHIHVTGNHKFFTSNRGWVRADELTEEDDIVDITKENVVGNPKLNRCLSFC